MSVGRLPPITDPSFVGRLQRALDDLNDQKQMRGNPVTLPSFLVATVPSAAQWPNAWIYVSNESLGAVPAFSDGANWRRCTDRAIIS